MKPGSERGADRRDGRATAGSGAFEEHRPRLHRLASRMLRNPAEADDILQRAWLRLARNPPDDQRTLGAWLTTTVTRLCIDELRRRTRAGGTAECGPAEVEQSAPSFSETPEHAALLADNVGVAMLVVLERLTPAERVAFILHDVFGQPFDEIAELIERSPEAARQLASRARRRVRTPAPEQTRERRLKRAIAERFVQAMRARDLQAIMELLTSDAVLKSDQRGASLGPGPELLGSSEIASFLADQRAEALELVDINGTTGLLVAPAGHLLFVVRLSFDGPRIRRLDVIASPDDLAVMELSLS